MFNLIKRKKNKNDESTSNELLDKNQNEVLDVSKDDEEMKIEVLDSIDLSNNELVEVTDSSLVTSIRDGVLLADAAKDVAKVVKKSGAIYKAIIPAGAKLTNSSEMKGAVRGIYHGADGIKGHANLIDISKQKKALTTAASFKAIVIKTVIKICISDINNKLTLTTKGIEYIEAIEEAKLKSEFEQIVSDLRRIIDNQDELLLNDDIRNNEIINLQSLNKDCCRLLGTTNNIIQRYSNNIPKEYKEFVSQINKIDNHIKFQQAGLNLLGYISEMTYVLNLGKLSKKNCNYALSDYIEKSQAINNEQLKWLNKSIDAMKIDLNTGTRGRLGIVGKAAGVANKLIKKDIDKAKVEESTLQSIESNKNICNNTMSIDKKELFDEDISFILKDNKVFYLK